MIRVLLVGPTLDTFPGGVAIQAQVLADRFNAEGEVLIEQHPITPTAPRPIRWLQRVPGVRTVVTGIVYLASLGRRIRRFDVVHVNSARFSSFVISSLPAVLVARLLRRPVVLEYHNGDLREELRRFRPIFRWLLTVPNLLVVPSPFLEEVLGEVSLRATVIANQVDVARFRFRDRRPLRPIFLSCRHFEDLYDIPTLIRAFSRIQAQYPDAELLVAGQGSREAAVRALVESLRLTNVSFVGQIDADRMANLYDPADILLNSSVVDNAPSSLIEAFAAGLPIVSTNAGGIPFLIRDRITGRLVDTGDDEGLAREAVALLESPEVAAAMARAARTEAEARFTWEAVRAAWLAAYHSVMAREGRG